MALQPEIRQSPGDQTGALNVEESATTAATALSIPPEADTAADPVRGDVLCRRCGRALVRAHAIRVGAGWRCLRHLSSEAVSE